MEEGKKTKSVFDRLMGWILALIVGMAFWSLAIHLADRFTGNDNAWSFYSETTHMTCIVARSKGKDLMACVPGDRRTEEDRDHE